MKPPGEICLNYLFSQPPSCRAFSMQRVSTTPTIGLPCLVVMRGCRQTAPMRFDPTANKITALPAGKSGTAKEE